MKLLRNFLDLRRSGAWTSSVRRDASRHPIQVTVPLPRVAPAVPDPAREPSTGERHPLPPQQAQASGPLSLASHR